MNDTETQARAIVDQSAILEAEFIVRTHIDWPFAKMKVGDSFLVPEGVKRASISAAMQRAEKSGKGMFISRAVDGVVRVWRFA